MSFPGILTPQAAQVWHLSQQLAAFERVPLAEQRKVQGRSLGDLLQWAWQHSAFWRERLQAVAKPGRNDVWAVLASLPTLTRNDLQTHFDAMDCGKALGGEEGCVLAKTSGSTGRPVVVKKQKIPYALRYQAQTMRNQAWHQIDPLKALVNIAPRKPDGIMRNWGAPESLFGPTGPVRVIKAAERDIGEIYSLFVKEPPGYLVTNASIAQGLAKYVLDNQLDAPSLDAIMSTGEACTQAVRRDCQQAFGARMIDRYSNEEVGWMAIQCPRYHHLHVLSANCIIEIVDEQGQPNPVGRPGKVLVTALHSEAMPLIRYETGDMAEWGESCDCGIQLPVIKRIWGREREFFRTPSGELRYMALLAGDFLDLAPLRDIRLRYYTNPLAVLEVVSICTLTKGQRDALRGKVQAMLGFECPVHIEEKAQIDWFNGKKIAFMSMNEVWPVR